MGGDRSSEAWFAQLPQRTASPIGKLTQKYKSRLQAFTENGQYASQNLQSKLYIGRYSDEEHVRLAVYSPPDLSRPSFKDATSNDFKSTHIGESFGPSWATHWFKVQLKVPQEIKDEELVVLQWDANNEGLIWTEEGEPVQGLTGERDRIEWILPSSFKDGQGHTIYIEMACNGLFGNAPPGGTYQPPDPNRYFTLHTAQIAAINQEARQLFFDFWILGDAAREFPESSWEQHKALRLSNKIIDTFDLAQGSQESILEARKLAGEYLGHVDTADVYGNGKTPLTYGIGHCHIDTCWLWPWDETKRKVARSWSNQCDLMDRYPEHRFTCSQAQQYKWLEQLYPKLFDRVKTKVKEGRFQPIGGSWVEHDTNVPSGESLIRQFLYGQRYFESRFGERCRTFWLPDTFGYSSQIPQVTRLAGMSRFFTQKLGWNEINDFPHSTFRWVGIDNSQVLCHMPPTQTYTAEAHFGDVNRSMTQHKSMDQDPRSLLVFGKGDGGGGPTWEHLEKLRRCRGMSDKTGLLPRVHLGDSVDDFYDKIEDESQSGVDFPTWFGELYLEKHRGTYTTQANNKRNNRKAEILMHDIEFLATFASVKDNAYHYPKKDIDEMWEGILLCQFHDCLPGSSIEMVYRDSDKLYEHIFNLGDRLKKGAYQTLGLRQSAGGDTKFTAVNTLPWPRKDLMNIPGVPRLSADRFYYPEGSIAMMNSRYTGQVGEKNKVTCSEVGNGRFRMSNSRLKVEIQDGTIISLYDQAEEREIIPQGAKANQFVLFEDKPLQWQAWDVDEFHLDTRQPLHSVKSSILEADPHKASIVTETKISDKSWIKTTISLTAYDGGEPSYVEMESEIEWHEKWKFLKVEFPVDILNTEASYETQYGITRRPTHYNTTWDMAKFEVCCHRFADLSENGYGVSILNDSKYGFAVAGNVMRLSLLRAPKQPDPHADIGKSKKKFPGAILADFDNRPTPYPLRYPASRGTVGFQDCPSCPQLPAAIGASRGSRHHRLVNIRSALKCSIERITRVGTRHDQTWRR